MIEVEEVSAFIDDVMVGIEIEKGHNNIVEEVLKRMEMEYENKKQRPVAYIRCLEA